MSILNTRERQVRPTHPGEMLREDFMPDYGLTVSGIAKALGVSRQTVNELLRERRAVSPEMALRLARLFGNTPEFWLNAQRAVDLMGCDKDRGQKDRKDLPSARSMILMASIKLVRSARSSLARAGFSQIHPHRTQRSVGSERA